MSNMKIQQFPLSTGLEMTGVDLKAPLTAKDSKAISQALNNHGVLFFRDQWLSPDQQVAFAQNFGHIPTVPDSAFTVHVDNPRVSVLECDAEHPPTVNNWHSDYSFDAEPDFGSVLQAIKVPEQGGDTLWCNMYACWEGLSDRMQNHIEGLSAVHDFMKLYERPAKKALWQGKTGEAMEKARQIYPPVSHPMVWTNPETGRKALFINESFTRHINDMSESESRHLLAFLFEQGKTPEYQVRFRWTEGTVALWDNRATNHYATADYFPNHRLMHRVTVLEKPRAHTY